LAEVKHNGQLKLQHPEPLALGRLLHIIIHWKNRWAAPHLLACQESTPRAHTEELLGHCPQGCCTPAGLLGCCIPASLQAHQAVTPMARQDTACSPACQLTGCHSLQEDTSTTRCQLQTC
jgi:hypothetical protein